MSEDRIYHALDRIEKKLDALGERTSDLEIWRATLNGKVAGFVAFATISLNIVWEVFRTKLKI